MLGRGWREERKLRMDRGEEGRAEAMGWDGTKRERSSLRIQSQPQLV